MIELLVRKEKLKSGSTAFVLEPSSFSIGGNGANLVDEIHLTVPEEWADADVTITFPTANGKLYPVKLDRSKTFKVTSLISTIKGSGTVVVDAKKASGYVAYSTGAQYTAYGHPETADSTGNFITYPAENWYERIEESWIA